jgi:chitinase
MIWALDLDDFRGKCGQGSHPLLKVIHAELQDDSVGEDEYEDEDPIDNAPQPETPVAVIPIDKPEENEIFEHEGSQVPDEENEIIGGEGEVTEEEEEEDYEDEDEDTNEIDEFDGQYKVVCYFTNWAWYRPGIGKFKPEDIDPDLCTHIVYGFAVLNRDTLTIQPHDSWADIDNHFYEKVTEFKKRGVKVTIAIGGWNDSAGDKYSRLVLNADARRRFVNHVTEFIEKHNFDGLDLDWEYPVCWQVECNKGKPEEKQAFTMLVKELSAAFKPKGLLLSSAVSPSKKVIDAGYEVKALSNYFDWVAVMCYDYHGQWDKKTGHVAPMYVHPESSEMTFNANFTMNYWIKLGANPRKLIMGMPMYGQSFSLADRSNVGLNSPSYGGGEAGEDTRARGFLSYYEVCWLRFLRIIARCLSDKLLSDLHENQAQELEG